MSECEVSLVTESTDWSRMHVSLHSRVFLFCLFNVSAILYPYMIVKLTRVKILWQKKRLSDVQLSFSTTGDLIGPESNWISGLWTRAQHYYGNAFIQIRLNMPSLGSVSQGPTLVCIALSAEETVNTGVFTSELHLGELATSWNM